MAKHLLQFPDKYKIRCLTRNIESAAAQSLASKGAEVVQGDLSDAASLSAAVKGCWGVFAVTNFYDSKIVDDPFGEERQGKNLAKAACDANVQCYIWSTLPSSREISKGKIETRIYEGKHNVDSYIREIGLAGVFLWTGNFYENLILRGHMNYDQSRDMLIFSQPIIEPSSSLTMLYVEKDLAGIVKAIFDHWDVKKQELDGQYLQASSARITPRDVCRAAEKVSGKRCEYIVLPSTGVPERDTMFRLYNEVGMYPGLSLPDPKVVAMGVELHTAEDFMKEKLLPHLGLDAVE